MIPLSDHRHPYHHHRRFHFLLSSGVYLSSIFLNVFVSLIMRLETKLISNHEPWPVTSLSLISLKEEQMKLETQRLLHCPLPAASTRTSSFSPLDGQASEPL